jgi:hypothetical protein
MTSAGPSATPGPGAANAEAPIVIAVDAMMDPKRRRAVLLFHPRQVGDERPYPCRPAIIRIRLLILVRIRLDVGPHGPHQDRLVIHGVLTNQHDSAVVEFTDIRRQCPDLAVRERLTPLVRARVVQKEREAFPVAFRPIRFDLLQFRLAVPHLAHGHCSIQFNGFRTARKWIKNSLDVGMPHANVEIKVVLPVVYRGCRRGCLRKADAGTRDTNDCGQSHADRCLQQMIQVLPLEIDSECRRAYPRPL